MKKNQVSHKTEVANTSKLQSPREAVISCAKKLNDANHALDSLIFGYVMAVISLIEVGMNVESGNKFFFSLFIITIIICVAEKKVIPLTRFHRWAHIFVLSYSLFDASISLVGLAGLFVVSGNGHNAIVVLSNDFAITTTISLNIGCAYGLLCLPLVIFMSAFVVIEYYASH